MNPIINEGKGRGQTDLIEIRETQIAQSQYFKNKKNVIIMKWFRIPTALHFNNIFC